MTTRKREFLIQPEIPLFVEDALELLAFVFLKLGVDAGFQWVEPQQGRREAMNSADIGAFEVAQRVMHPGVELVFRKLVELDQGIRLLVAAFFARSSIGGSRFADLPPGNFGDDPGAAASFRWRLYW